MTLALSPPHHIRGATFGLMAAMLFGISAPVSKVLLSDLPPLLLAALLYLGAGGALLVVTPFAPRQKRNEAPLRRSDLPLLFGIVVTGGILRPYLMLAGLQRVSGLAGSLLLNLEAPFTMLVALLFFGEHLGRREVLAAALIVAGGVLLEGAPSDVNIASLRETVASLPGVKEVHDLHVWALTSGVNAMSAHVVVIDPSAHNVVLSAAHDAVTTTFPIEHVTVQIERIGCRECEAHL